MTTIVAVSRENSREAVTPIWEGINSMERCPRCSRFMVTEWCGDLDQILA